MAITMKNTLISNAIAGLRMMTQSEGAAPDEDFYVERWFLRHHLEDDTVRCGSIKKGLGNISLTGRPCTCQLIIVKCFRHGVIDPSHVYTFAYYNERGNHFGPGHGLLITDEDDNILYWREPGQDPRAEWQINDMAGDVTDENCHLVFVGDPYNI